MEEKCGERDHNQFATHSWAPIRGNNLNKTPHNADKFTTRRIPDKKDLQRGEEEEKEEDEGEKFKNGMLCDKPDNTEHAGNHGRPWRGTEKERKGQQDYSDNQWLCFCKD